jgi:hypothetical protein
VSVRPVRFEPDGGIEVVHDEAGHGGTVAFADIAFGRNPDGTLNPDFIVLTCPVAGCGAVSVHPVGGGAAPGEVQKLFARTVMRRAAALGIPVAQRNWAGIKGRIRARVQAMDGPERRFYLERMQGEDDPPEA